MTQTNLTEPVQVGLWYEKRNGIITKIKSVSGDWAECIEGYLYNSYGQYDVNSPHEFDWINGEQPDVDISKTETTTTTQFERILTAMLSGFSQNHLFDEPKDFITYAIAATKEAIKQLKEIEGA